MHIRLGNVGKIKIDDKRQVADVNAARSNICCDKHANCARFEAGEGVHAGGLALVAVDGHSRNTGSRQLAHNAVGTVLGGGKDEDGCFRPLLQKPDEKPPLVGLVHLVKLLLDGLDRGRGRRDLDAHRVAENLLRKRRDLLRHGGGKEKRLPL